MSERTLLDQRDACGCCEGTRDRVPASITNRPGLREIGYRVGTYALFKQSLLAGLTDGSRAALGGLLTRDDDDFAIGLIDAWAMVGDVLTFYAERAVQEHYLGTATERDSVSALVHLIGYRPQPGLAASTALAFTLEASPLPPYAAPPGAPERVPINTGTRVQSIPGPEERPQTFETVEDLEALVAWNRLTPRLTEERNPHDGDTSTYLRGSSLNLAPGDSLLFIAEKPISGPRPSALARVTAVSLQPESNRTLVTWAPHLTKLAPVPSSGGPGAPVQVFVLRQRTSLFGYNAPDPRLFSNSIRSHLGSDINDKDWNFKSLDLTAIDLESVVPGLKPSGWAVLVNPAISDPELVEITGVSERSRSGYAISARVTSLSADPTDDSAAAFPAFGGANTRDTVVLLGSVDLPIDDTPINTPIVGSHLSIQADQALDPPVAPRKIVIRGRLVTHVTVTATGVGLFTPDAASALASAPVEGDTLTMLGYRQEPVSPGKVFWQLKTDSGVIGEMEMKDGALEFQPSKIDDPVVAEVAFVVPPAAAGTTGKITNLDLRDPLQHVYDRATVEIFGNVAAATHGESVRGEVLGSGDAARPYQQFTLDKGPLTYTISPDPAGKSTLEVQINDVRWDEATSFFGASPRDRIYVTGVTEKGETAVRFGDGVNGARPQTGIENIRASYRTGIGAAGNLDPDRLTLLMTRPLGVKGVTNPLPASGGVESQTGDKTRDAAPLTVLTLDRIVSLQDYEDYARAFPGVDKAAAVNTWDGARQGILLTVAGTDGSALTTGVPTYDSLVEAITAAGNPHIIVQVKSYVSKRFCIAATLLVDDRHNHGQVLALAQDQLRSRFSFAARSFGQPVSLGEVTAALQSVPGVVAVDVDQLYVEGETALLNPFLVAEAPASGAPPNAPAAELLTLHPDSLDYVKVQP